MAEYADREHYIPLHRAELVDLLASERDLPRAEAVQFRNLSELLASTIHFEHRALLEQLKTVYRSFDPDRQARPLHAASADERARQLGALFDEFAHLMEQADYRAVTEAEIAACNGTETALGVKVGVDLQQFERLAIHVRGNTVERRIVRRMANLWRQEDVIVPLFQRVVMILKLRPSRWTGSAGRADRVFIQIFKDIPRRDLAALLPGARVRMTPVDRGKIGFPLATGLAFAAWKIMTELADDLAKLLLFNHPLAVWAVASGTVGYSGKSYLGYQQTRQRYQHNLTQVLYFQNLDTNSGVFFRVLDEAEEQEGREALLAYYFLWRHAGTTGWTATALDDYIEIDLERRASLKVDFDVAQALPKLEKRGIIQRVEDRYRAVPIDRALVALDDTWDNYFKYANPEPTAARGP